jgi:redox-sensitive bicupin YhaK (pirin superfamily)
MKVTLHFYTSDSAPYLKRSISTPFLTKVVFSTLYADVKEPSFAPAFAGPPFPEAETVWFEFSGSTPQRPRPLWTTKH